MNSGWIKLHRQIQDSSFYGQPIAVALWVECLLRAAHEGKERFIGREKIYLEPGQFVMGYREFADKVGCGTATAKAWMDAFEKEGMVERSRNAKGTVCKLKKWSEYQDTRTQTEQARNADGTLTEPNKNVKNEKNVKNYTVDDEILKWLKKFDSTKNPTAYLSSILKKASRNAINKAWNEAKRGNGIESPSDFYSRCIFWKEHL